MSVTNLVVKAASEVAVCAEPYLEEELEYHDDDPVIVMPAAFDKHEVFPEPLDEVYDDELVYEGLPKHLIEAGITAQDYADAEYCIDECTAKSPVERLFGPASELFGKFWQRPLARAMKVTPGHLSQVVTGKRNLTAELERKAVDAMLREHSQAKTRLARATAGLINILNETKL